MARRMSYWPVCAPTMLISYSTASLVRMIALMVKIYDLCDLVIVGIETSIIHVRASEIQPAHERYKETDSKIFVSSRTTRPEQIQRRGGRRSASICTVAIEHTSAPTRGLTPKFGWSKPASSRPCSTAASRRSSTLLQTAEISYKFRALDTVPRHASPEKTAQSPHFIPSYRREDVQ